MEIETLTECLLCGSDSIQTVDPYAQIAKCGCCGYIFDSPRPTVRELISFYSQAGKYDSWLMEEDARNELWCRRLSVLLPFMKSGSLLDVGTGIGQFLASARDSFSAVYGTEVSESAVQIARQKYGLDLIRGEIEQIDFGSTRFDNITIFHVLEHVPNPKLVIQKCRELLSPGGSLIIAVPNDVHSIKAGMKQVLKHIGIPKFQNVGRMGLRKIVLDGSIPEIHLSHFTPASLNSLVGHSGFQVVLSSLDPYYVATGLKKQAFRTQYEVCRLVQQLFHTNIYDTILLVAKKL